MNKKRVFMYEYQRIKDLREDNDLKQESIAKKLNISQQQYHLYESGKREIPFHLIIELAKYYNVSIDYLAGIHTAPITLREHQEKKENNFTQKEKELLEAYKKHKRLQEAVDKLLDIEEVII